LATEVTPSKSGFVVNPLVEFPLISECMIAQGSAGSRRDARGEIASGSMNNRNKAITSTEDNGIQKPGNRSLASERSHGTSDRGSLVD
jgi:hypothetical protein